MIRAGWKIAAVIMGVAVSAVGTLRCVGDAAVPPPLPDSGTPPNDQVSPPIDAPADTLTPDGAPGQPSPDGSLGWIDHYNTNYGATAIVVREGTTPSYVVAGNYRNTIANGPDHFTKLGNNNNTPPTTNNSIAPLVLALDQNGNVTWAKGIANSGDNVYYDSIAVDSAGDIYLSGWIGPSATITFAQPHTGIRVFVTKLKGDGSAFVWDHTFKADSSGIGTSRLAVSGSNVALSLSWSGILTDESTNATVNSAGSSDVFVATLATATGNTTWSKQIGGPGYEAMTAIATDTNGDIYMSGLGDGTIAGPGTGFPLKCFGTGTNAIVVKLGGASGAGVWARAFGDTGASYTQANAIGVRNGVVGVTGGFNGSVDFGMGLAGSAGSTDGFVAALDATSSTTKFATTIGGSGYDNGTGIGVDPWGNVIATATFTSSDAKVGSKPLPPSFFNASSMVNVKWSSTGTVLWSNPVISTAPDGKSPPYTTQDIHNDPQLPISGANVAVSNSGDVFVAGLMVGGANFGDGTYRGRLSGISDPNPNFPNGTCKFSSAPCPPNLAPDWLVLHLVP